MPLYSLVCVACKGPAVAPLQAASLSRVHMWTGHNCRLCCQEKRWLRVPVFSICPFLYYQGWQREKNNRRVIPPYLCDLDKSVFLWPADFKSSLPDLSGGAKASSFLLKYFLHRLVCCGIVLCWSNSAQMCCQELCISLTDALCTSSLCFVPWFELLFWSNSVYFCPWVYFTKNMISPSLLDDLYQCTKQVCAFIIFKIRFIYM